MKGRGIDNCYANGKLISSLVTLYGGGEDSFPNCGIIGGTRATHRRVSVITCDEYTFIFTFAFDLNETLSGFHSDATGVAWRCETVNFCCFLRPDHVRLGPVYFARFLANRFSSSGTRTKCRSERRQRTIVPVLIVSQRASLACFYSRGLKVSYRAITMVTLEPLVYYTNSIELASILYRTRTQLVPVIADKFAHDPQLAKIVADALVSLVVNFSSMTNRELTDWVKQHVVADTGDDDGAVSCEKTIVRLIDAINVVDFDAITDAIHALDNSDVNLLCEIVERRSLNALSNPCHIAMIDSEGRTQSNLSLKKRTPASHRGSIVAGSTVPGGRWWDEADPEAETNQYFSTNLRVQQFVPELLYVVDDSHDQYGLPEDTSLFFGPDLSGDAHHEGVQLEGLRIVPSSGHGMMQSNVADGGEERGDEEEFNLVAVEAGRKYLLPGGRSTGAWYNKGSDIDDGSTEPYPNGAKGNYLLAVIIAWLPSKKFISMYENRLVVCYRVLSVDTATSHYLLLLVTDLALLGPFRSAIAATRHVFLRPSDLREPLERLLDPRTEPFTPDQRHLLESALSAAGEWFRSRHVSSFDFESASFIVDPSRWQRILSGWTYGPMPLPDLSLTRGKVPEPSPVYAAVPEVYRRTMCVRKSDSLALASGSEFEFAGLFCANVIRDLVAHCLGYLFVQVHQICPAVISANQDQSFAYSVTITTAQYNERIVFERLIHHQQRCCMGSRGRRAKCIAQTPELVDNIERPCAQLYYTTRFTILEAVDLNRLGEQLFCLYRDGQMNENEHGPGSLNLLDTVELDTLATTTTASTATQVNRKRKAPPKSSEDNNSNNSSNDNNNNNNNNNSDKGNVGDDGGNVDNLGHDAPSQRRSASTVSFSEVMQTHRQAHADRHVPFDVDRTVVRIMEHPVLRLMVQNLINYKHMVNYSSVWQVEGDIYIYTLMTAIMCVVDYLMQLVFDPSKAPTFHSDGTTINNHVTGPLAGIAGQRTSEKLNNVPTMGKTFPIRGTAIAVLTNTPHNNSVQPVRLELGSNVLLD